MNAMLLTDGYKLDHRRQYPKGTEYVYSNWTPRSNEYFPQASDGAVVFGIQYFIKKYLIEYFNDNFFKVEKDIAVKNFARRINTFPDGEKHLKINELDRKDTVKIVCRITNSDELFLLMQLSDILNRQCVIVEEMIITYLMAMRCDRLFSLEQPFSLGIVANVINSFNVKNVVIVEPHSDISLDLIKNSKGAYLLGRKEDDSFIYCYPDKGAKLRYGNRHLNHKPIVCSKVRDVKTGELKGFEIIDKGDYRKGMKIAVIDDLCDGGGTFIGIAEKLRELNPSILSLGIVHAIQKQGIEKVAKCYDSVTITTSYKDWDKESLPSNVNVSKLNA